MYALTKSQVCLSEFRWTRRYFGGSWLSRGTKTTSTRGTFPVFRSSKMSYWARRVKLWLCRLQ